MATQFSSESSPRSERPIIVLLDANVWISELMLKSFSGASLVDLLSRSAGKILFPEIVERELNQGILRQAQSSGKKATDEIGRLKRLMGQELNFVPPSSEVIEKAIKAGLQALEPLLIREKFTFEHAVSALDRILSGQPPCGPNNEQFRDACIWQDCISHGKHNKVYFVTDDKAFYESKALEKGLAIALKDELKAAEVDVEVFSKIGDLYDQIAPDAPERNTKEIGQKIAQELGSGLGKILIDYGFADGKLSKQSIALKQTGSPTRQFGTFNLTFTLSNAVGDDARLDPTVNLEGSFSFDVPSGDVQNVTLDRQTVAWTAPDGKEVRATAHHLRVNVVESLGASTAIGFF